MKNMGLIFPRIACKLFCLLLCKVRHFPKNGYKLGLSHEHSKVVVWNNCFLNALTSRQNMGLTSDQLQMPIDVLHFYDNK